MKQPNEQILQTGCLKSNRNQFYHTKQSFLASVHCRMCMGLDKLTPTHQRNTPEMDGLHGEKWILFYLNDNSVFKSVVELLSVNCFQKAVARDTDPYP